MIVQRFTSGLGNQMFQYAFSVYISKKYPDKIIKADLTWFDWHNEHQGFELERLFRLNMNKASRAEVLKCSGELPLDFPAARYVNRAIRLVAEKYFIKYRIDEMKPGQTVDLRHNWYLTGFYESEAFYKDDLTEIRKIYTFPDAGNEDIRNQILKSDSVSIHVRRGDYLNKGYTERFIKLDMDYYRKAVGIIKESIPDARFFVFSEDKEYINESFGWLDNKYIVEGNDGADSWKDMYLMSLCRHNITANSTFSTWGALLNAHENAIVVYPKAYLTDEDSEIKTIPGWIRI